MHFSKKFLVYQQVNYNTSNFLRGYMQVSIEYCGMWNYYPKASSLKADLEKEFSDISIKLIEGKNGVFEVEKDGNLIFSKKKVGRFPEHEEIFEKLNA